MGPVKLLQNGERRHGLGSRVPGNVQNTRCIKVHYLEGPPKLTSRRSCEVHLKESNRSCYARNRVYGSRQASPKWREKAWARFEGSWTGEPLISREELSFPFDSAHRRIHFNIDLQKVRGFGMLSGYVANYCRF